MFSVKDSGPGIPADKIDLLFRYFTQIDGSVTRQYGGTGLGLSISQRLVGLMGGQLKVQSALGRGSTFYFNLLLERGPEERPLILTPPADIRGLKALVVDDNETARHILAQMLTSFEFEVSMAASGSEGLSELITAAASRHPYELVLVDWKMAPVDGFEFARSIRVHPLLGNKPQTPKIILITMHGREDYQAALGEEKDLIDGYLLKPVSSSELFNAIMEAFGKETAMVPLMVFEVESTEPAGIEKMRGAKILLVEDHEINQQVAAAILERAGMEVTVAPNGKAAIDRLKGIADKTGRCHDAVLMDIEMPIMDGYTASQLIREDPRFADLPLIAMTAHALKGDRERCLAAGMSDFVAKPIDETQLFNVLLKWIHPKGNRFRPQATPLSGHPTPPPTEKTPITLAGIDSQAALRRINGNTALYKKMLRSFLEKHEQVGYQIKDYVEKGDLKVARHLTHALIGICGNIGADELSRIARELNALLEDPHASGETEPIASILDEMQTLLSQNDSRSRHCLAKMQASLLAPPDREDLALLDRELYKLDFKAARVVLSRIKGRLEQIQASNLNRSDRKFE